MPRIRLVLAAAVLAAAAAPLSAHADPDPPCELRGGPQLEIHDGRPVVVLHPYYWVC